MAKGTKKKEMLTPEEKLQQALVPVEEQPYPVPGNWCWTYIGKIVDIYLGLTHTPKYVEEGVPFLSVKNISSTNYIDYENTKKISKAEYDSLPIGAKPKKGDILFARVGTIGIPHIVEDDIDFGTFVSLGFFRIREQTTVLPKLIVYWMNSVLFYDQVKKSVKGSTLINLNTGWLKNFFFPLPPLQEQQRIVARIESLFAKLDEVKEKAQAVVDGYEDRKAAILHKAFTGELTAKWREEKGLNLNWKNKRINEVSIPRAGFAFNSKKFCNSGFQIIRMGNLYAGELNLTRNPVFIDQKDIDSAILKRALIKDGDILITLTGTKYKRDYGYAVRISGIENLLVNQRILCLTPKDDIFPDYLLHYLCSDLFRNIFFSNETGGVNQGNVSSKFVENINIPFPDFNEQIQIAKMVNDFLNNETSIKFIAQSVLDQIDNMKKSILARAFRGQLGTNDPADEPAVELLKKVLEEEK